MGATLSTLTRLSFGALDLGSIQSVAKDSPLLIVVLVVFMMLVYSFFFNLLVSPPDGVLRAVMGLSTTLFNMCFVMHLHGSFHLFCGLLPAFPPPQGVSELFHWHFKQFVCWRSRVEAVLRSLYLLGSGHQGPCQARN